jgi:NADH dehydrogenase
MTAQQIVTVFGGSGFIGRYVLRALCRAGYRVRVATRRPHLAGDLRLAGNPGQVHLVQANVRDPASVAAALEGADAAINLVGILFEKGKQSFKGTQGEGARIVAEAAAQAGVTRFVQMSAIGADAMSKSAYGRTKGLAEVAVQRILPFATILRPSIVFGPEDDFLNRFAAMARVTPALPLIGGGKTRFQPVFVGDVADAVVAALKLEAAKGKIYELGGPGIFTFKEVLTFITETIGRPRLLAPLPFFIAKPMGTVMDVVFRLNPFAGPPLTGDQVEMLKKDNVVGAGFSDVGTLADLGVTVLESMESIAPTYLMRFRPFGQFQPKSG